MAFICRVLPSDCTGCGICADSCSFDAIDMGRDAAYPVVQEDRCVGCMDCHRECPFGAIEAVPFPEA